MIVALGDNGHQWMITLLLRTYVEECNGRKKFGSLFQKHHNLQQTASMCMGLKKKIEEFVDTQ